tara:strand:+ start:40 stop:522 length:483 start_codon:yes stop_codon:yes gene_type:complete
MIFFKIKSLTFDLENGIWFPNNDLYIKIKYGNQKRRTTIKWNQSRAIWNESFLFERTEEENITLTIMNGDVLHSTDVLNECTINGHYGKIKSFKTHYLEFDMGDIFYDVKIEKIGDLNIIKSQKQELTIMKQEEKMLVERIIGDEEKINKYNEIKMLLNN